MVLFVSQAIRIGEDLTMSLVIIVLVLSLIGISTIVINIVTLLIIFKCNRLQKPSNYPIISFLVTGIIQGAIVVPVYCVKRLDLAGSPDWICDLFRFPYFLCGHMTALSILLVALERFAAIQFTFKYNDIVNKRNTLLILAVTWVAFIIIDILPFINGAKQSSKCSYVPWREWSVAVLVLTIVIPMIFIALTYAWIWKQAIKHAERIQTATKSSHASKGTRFKSRLELRATRTTLLLVGIFFLTWAPIGIYYLVENICDDCITNSVSPHMQEDFKFWVKAVSYTSCVFSPLAYCWRTREFQEELRTSLRNRNMRAPAFAIRFAQRLSKDKNHGSRDTNVDSVETSV